MKIYFARHGESLANTLHIISNTDLAHTLTEQGRAQARDLVARLAGIPLTRIYTSPVLRARETAEIVAAALHVPVEVAEGLKEYDCGNLEGRSDEAAWAVHQQFVHDWLAGRNRDQAPDRGETYFDIRQRLGIFVSRVVDKYNGSEADILCVSHGGTLLFGLPGLISNVDSDFIRQHGFPHTILISVELRDGRLVCTRWGDVILDEAAT